MAPQSKEIVQFARDIQGGIRVWLDGIEYVEGEAGFSVKSPVLAHKLVAVSTLAKFEAMPVQRPLNVLAARHKHTARDQVSDYVDASPALRLQVLLLQ
ncbi:MAG: hypothetical protein JWP59_219 [Massilia sp.]|jgi:hypothetical protein|nr:hypothetical protein [Massilia sp.]